MRDLEVQDPNDFSPASQTLHPHIIAQSFTKIKFPITDAVATVENLESQGYDFSKREWHHNEVMGFMEWLPEANNNFAIGGSEFTHKGGVNFWEMLHGADYK